MHQNLQTRDQHSSVVVCIRIKIRMVVIRDQLLNIYMLLHCVKCNMKFSIGKTSSTSENLQAILFALHLTIEFAIGYQFKVNTRLFVACRIVQLQAPLD